MTDEQQQIDNLIKESIEEIINIYIKTINKLNKITDDVPRINTKLMCMTTIIAARGYANSLYKISEEHRDRMLKRIYVELTSQVQKKISAYEKKHNINQYYENNND